MGIELSDLHIGHYKRALAGPFDLHIGKGDLIALLGPNGCGKSTFLRTLMGDIPAISGKVTLLNQNSKALLAQTKPKLSDAPICVRDLVAMGLWSKLGAFGRACHHDQDAIDKALELVGMADLAKAPIAQLSGGQMQRVLFARLAVQDCDLILLDEPFNALDVECRDDLMAVLYAWHRQGKTIIAAVHDVEIARQFPIWIEMRDGGAQVSAHDTGDGFTQHEPSLRVISGGVQ